jgi:hypothetical protein
MSCIIGVFTADRNEPALSTLRHVKIAPFTSLRRDITWDDMTP